jgi:hypothetical protein
LIEDPVNEQYPRYSIQSIGYQRFCDTIVSIFVVMENKKKRYESKRLSNSFWPEFAGVTMLFWMVCRQKCNQPM